MSSTDRVLVLRSKGCCLLSGASNTLAIRSKTAFGTRSAPVRAAFRLRHRFSGVLTCRIPKPQSTVQQSQAERTHTGIQLVPSLRIMNRAKSEPSVARWAKRLRRLRYCKLSSTSSTSRCPLVTELCAWVCELFTRSAISRWHRFQATGSNSSAPLASAACALKRSSKEMRCTRQSLAAAPVEASRSPA